MYLYSGALNDKKYKMIAKDYYEKFEKRNKKPSSFRDMSITALQERNDSFLPRLIDKNYVITHNYLECIDVGDYYVALVENSHTIAYAIIQPGPFTSDKVTYIVDDIIIHNEDSFEELADGEISIRRNIYRKMVEYIENVLTNRTSFILNFRLIDSEDLLDVLAMRGYICNNDLNEETANELVEKGILSMHKSFTIKNTYEDDDELRLTRK